ncbi:MAG: MBL fold metallo-hydrolase [Firmicutes bacterium]|nr:MBL fold metallo-hydrolase [Bacillota bacterium]
MKLTILGNYGTFPGVNGACSGYFIQDESTRILIDCGNGTISRLQRYCRIEDIDMIILSHLHFDHIADIFPLKYAIETKVGMNQNMRRMRLCLPMRPSVLAEEICRDNVFDHEFIMENSEITAGGLKISFARVPHLIESYAIIIIKGEKRFVYSGDTCFGDEITEAAKGADLFLCESSVLEKTGGTRLAHHMSAGAAGRVAASSGVNKLILTHFWYEEKREKYLSEAKKYFKNVWVSEEFSTYEI